MLISMVSTSIGHYLRMKVFFFPQGSSWEHILTDLSIVSISVGSKRRVWVIAENGTAYFRAGFGENKIIGMDCNMKEKSSHLPAG